MGGQPCLSDFAPKKKTSPSRGSGSFPHWQHSVSLVTHCCQEKQALSVQLHWEKTAGRLPWSLWTLSCVPLPVVISICILPPEQILTVSITALLSSVSPCSKYRTWGWSWRPWNCSCCPKWGWSWRPLKACSTFTQLVESSAKQCLAARALESDKPGF